MSELPLVCEALRLHYPQISLALNPFSALKKDRVSILRKFNWFKATNTHIIVSWNKKLF